MRCWGPSGLRSPTVAISSSLCHRVPPHPAGHPHSTHLPLLPACPAGVTVFSNPFLEMLAEEEAAEEKQQQKQQDEDDKAGQAEVGRAAAGLQGRRWRCGYLCVPVAAASWWSDLAGL
jgi:hypothetical protein